MKTLAIFTIAFIAGTASADFTDFSNDATGVVANGFTSVDALGIVFSDTLGADLQIADWAHQSAGNGLAINGDDASTLRMDFVGNVSDIFLDFGNDDSGFHGGDVWAWMIGYNGGFQVDMTGFLSNGDDILNETIGLTGNFDAAEFYYGDASGNAINLIEIVDNVRTTAIPAPGTAALLGLSGLLVGRRRR